MNGKKVFVDTNILVYAHDRDAGERHERARQLIDDLWNFPVVSAVSVQVLQELYVTLLRKRVAPIKAREVVADFLLWDVVENTKGLLLNGIAMQQRYKLSFWDALILAAAYHAKAAELWSEDFNVGQAYDGVRAVNPLAG